MPFWLRMKGQNVPDLLQPAFSPLILIPGASPNLHRSSKGQTCPPSWQVFLQLTRGIVLERVLADQHPGFKYKH